MPGIIELPVLVNDKGDLISENNFVCKVIDNYNNKIKSNLENNKKLDRLKLDIEQNIEYVTNAETANKFVDWCKTADHVYNSAAIAKSAISRKAKELGLVFNSSTKMYEDPQTPLQDGKAS